MIFKPRDSGVPGFASDQEGPSVHLAAICDDLGRAIDTWAKKWSANA